MKSLKTLKALKTYTSALVAEDCVAGTFRYNATSGRMQWSDEIYSVHGYRRGDVVPTVDLLLSHKHHEDRERCRDIFDEVSAAGGYFCSYHRIIDARRREHQVLAVGEGVLDDAGRVCMIDGFIIDLSGTLRRETERVAGEAVQRATITRSTIEQAKGILMGTLHIGSDVAFELLVTYSQHGNLKISSIAADLVDMAGDQQKAELLDSFIAALNGVFRAHRP